MQPYVLRRETRYGTPAADQILVNRYYMVGYSYYFRQAKWALEIVSKDLEAVDRINNFRPDYRVPRRFRTDLQDFRGSGFDRGHLVSSANHDESVLENSETFLLSNMAPQAPHFNRGIWRKLETDVRALNNQAHILETYVLCGPIFDFDQPIHLIGVGDDNEVSIPVPHAFFKSVLTEDLRGNLHMWSFVLPNAASTAPLADFRVPTTRVEDMAGILLWSGLVGPEIEKEKRKKRPYWNP